MQANRGFERHSSSEAEQLISNLCKGVIGVAHAAGRPGALESDAFLEFSHRGASLAQFNLFIESMARAGLIARSGDKRLHATVRGLAYAGIDARPDPPAGSARA